MSNPVSPSDGLGVLHLFLKVGRQADAAAVRAAVSDAMEAGDQVVPVAVLGHKADVAFMSILSRRAIGSEQHLLDRELRAGGPTVFSDLIWALLNTPEFLFVK